MAPVPEYENAAVRIKQETPPMLPDWFRANRVMGHTRLPFRVWGDEQEFAHAAGGFNALGAGVFTRHVKSGDEDPWPRAVWR